MVAYYYIVTVAVMILATRIALTRNSRDGGCWSYARWDIIITHTIRIGYRVCNRLHTVLQCTV